MADESKTRKLDPDDRATRQEIADALGTTPDDPAVTKWIHDHNSDVRVLLSEGGTEGADSPPTAEPAVPTRAHVTSEDPFTGETYTIADVEPGRLSTDEEQEIRNLQERIELAERGITPESFLDPNGIATPAREVQIGSTHVTTHEVVYPDRRVVTITDRVDADGDGTRTERLKDFSTEIDGVRETPLEAGLPAGPAVVVSGTQHGTPNFGPAEDTRPTTPEELIDNTDLLDAIRPGGPTTDAGKALLDQFPGAGNTPMSSNTGGSNQPGSGTSTPNPATPGNPSSGESGDVPGGYSPEFPSSGSASSDDSDFDADTPATSEPAAGAGEGPGVARVTGSYSDSTGTGVSWVDTDGNWWTNTTRPDGT